MLLDWIASDVCITPRTIRVVLGLGRRFREDHVTLDTAKISSALCHNGTAEQRTLFTRNRHSVTTSEADPFGLGIYNRKWGRQRAFIFREGSFECSSKAY